MRLARSFSELDTYQLAFRFQQTVFEETRAWPGDERYSLTDQIRRSSRAVGANLAEAWAKRRYEAHFISKLTDADGEIQETLHWLNTARACGYLEESRHKALSDIAQQLGGMLGAMVRASGAFTLHDGPLD